MLKDHEDYGPKLDEVYTLGETYDAIQRGDTSVSSPIRRSKLLNISPSYLCVL